MNCYMKSIALAVILTTSLAARADVETTNHYTFSYGVATSNLGPIANGLTVYFEGDTGFLNYSDNTITNIRNLNVLYNYGSVSGPYQVSGLSSEPAVITRTGLGSNFRAVNTTTGAELDIGNIDGVYSIFFQNMTASISTPVTENDFPNTYGSSYPSMGGNSGPGYYPAVAPVYRSSAETFNQSVWDLTEISLFSPGLPPTTPTTPTAPTTPTIPTVPTPIVPAISPVTDPMVGAVPEPQTYAMLLAGLGALGLVVRRRRAA